MRPTAARSARVFATGPTESEACRPRGPRVPPGEAAVNRMSGRDRRQAGPHPRALQRPEARQLRQPTEHGKMAGIEPARLVADFAEGGLHDLFRLDGVAQDAEGQGPEAQGVPGGQLREGANVTLGHPLQQGDIRDGRFPEAPAPEETPTLEGAGSRERGAGRTSGRRSLVRPRVNPRLGVYQ